MIDITTYVVIEGDTLQSIAQKVLGDATKSLEIAVFNDLDYPFIGSFYTVLTGDAKVAMPGDTIEIPGSEYSYTPTEEGDLYGFGSDILLNRYSADNNLSTLAGGEFSSNIYGDLQTVSGFDCLSQDLINRMVTPVGTLPYHPEYGSTLLEMIGSKKDIDWKQRVQVELVKTLRSDPRVEKVEEVILQDVTLGIAISCKVYVSDTQCYILNTTIKNGGV